MFAFVAAKVTAVVPFIVADCVVTAALAVPLLVKPPPIKLKYPNAELIFPPEIDE